jgi:hypothetical protein
VTKVHKVLKDLWVVKVVKVERAHKDPLVMWVIPPQALKVTKAQQAVKEILVQQD